MDKNREELDYIRRLYEERVQAAVPYFMEAADLMDLVEYYEKQGLDHEAEACLRYALRLHPDDVDLLLTKAYRLKTYGRWSEALELVRSLPAQDLREVKMFYFECLLNEMRPDEAEAYLDREFFQDKGMDVDYDVYVEAAELYLDYNFPDLALRALRHVPATFGSEKQKAELEADAYAEKGDFQRAEEVMNRSLDADPYDEISWMQMADIQYKGHRFAAAYESCNYALAINPDNEQALRVRACAAAEEGGIADFETPVQAYLEKYPDDYNVQYLLGQRYSHEKDYVKAAAALQKAYRACPVDVADKQKVLTALVYAYAHEGKTSLALEALSSAYTPVQSPFEHTFQLASLVFDLGMPAQALALLNKYLSLYSPDGEEVMRLAALLCKYGCFEPARPLWERLLALPAADAPMATSYLALGAYRLGRLREALVCLCDAVARMPHLVGLLFADVFPGVRPADMPAEVERMLKKGEGD